MNSYYQEYCTGCGLCQNKALAKMEYNDDGFPYPTQSSSKANDFCSKVCPMSKDSLLRHTSSHLWGTYKGFYSGYAADKKIRFEASSGGILTTICVYLLQFEMVSGIIQTKADPNCPTETITVVSRSISDVKKCCGSRYSVSMPLAHIDSLISDGGKYAFIGKPCDIVALKNYAVDNDRIQESIIYYFSFFCAGTPSRLANEQMLRTLGCPQNECKSFHYRGNGWPGYVTAISKDGKEYKMDYYTAWMTVLGRVIKKSCKFCVDSIGEGADISCGDFWYLTNEKKPSFADHDGINCIFTWTDKGQGLIDKLADKGYICIKKENLDRLKFVQPNHYYRRSTIFYRWLAMKCAFKKAPDYPLNKMIKLSRNISFKKGLGCFKGTVLRIIKGRI